MIQAPHGQGGWLVPLADLSLILFIVTGGAMTVTTSASAPPPEPAETPAQGIPSAFYVDGQGSPALADLVALHEPAEGELLTITGYYAPGQRQPVIERTEELARQSIERGIEPRIVLQPDVESSIIAVIAHDAPP